MRKRRVLALLLALSLVVSGNGMTVLAAEQGADMPVSMSQEETQDIEDNSEEKEEASDSTEETSGTEDKSEETKTPEEGDTSDGEDGTEQGDTTENPENPDNAGETDPSAPKEDDTEQGGDQPPAEDGEQNGDQPTTEDGEDGGQEEEPGTEEQDPAADVQEPSVSENDVVETEEPEELEEKTGEVRMMSFTDASGLQITFDANAAAENAEKVTIDENGVLTAVDSSVEGVVDLRKKEFTEIGEGAFQGKSAITYVMLPKTVTSIGKNGFYGCASLKGISIPSKLSTIGEGAFETCTNLTQLAIPNSVTSIGANAFKGDDRLFMVNMPSADYSRLETIGDSAFEGCSVLEFFCSDDDYDLPDSVKTIGVSAFKNCVSIKEVDMADGITSLGASAYQGCEGLQKVEIAGGFTAVPERAFADCHNLIKLEFGALAYCVTIESFAFENCISLASVDITEDVSTIKVNAFKGCEKLLRIYITSKRTILENMAFPNNKNMCMIASEKNLEARRYAKENGVERLIFYDEIGRGDYYSYTADVTCPAGKVEITVTKEISASATDINKVVNKDGVPPYNVGVKAGTECFVMINLGNYKDTLRLVPGSLRCNGEEIDYDKNRRVYHFNMPNGGAAITAEFEFIDKENIVEGNKDTIEGRLSSDVDYDFERNIAYMQEGKSAKFYLISTYKGKVTRIPTSKINYRIAQGSKKGIVSVDAKGEVKALKEGTSIVEAVVMTNGGEVIKDLTVVVKASTGIDHIRVQLDENKYKTLTVDRDENGLIDGVSLETMSVNSKEFKFEIEADAFSVEDDDKMKVAFTWVSSDTKVAKLKKSSTAAGSSDNEITIPRGADGEATITVSAKGKDNRKVTKKFVVSVQNYAPRLTESKIVVNPKQTDSTVTLGFIEAYGYAVDTTEIVSAYDKTNGSPVGGFTFEFVKKEGVVSTYKVRALGKEPGTYNVKLRVHVKVGTASKECETPLTIEIKESQPTPTVSFDKKAEKINLFLAKDGVEIKPVIGKLGDDVVSEFSLEPLTESDHKNYEDDKKFTENFQIDPKTGTITQKADNLLKNKAGKPVLTGYLALKFEGYGDLKKKYKITIPTKTTAPAYVLDRTTDTFGVGFSAEQTVYLQLLDKKTKKPIEWDEGFTDGVTIDTDATTFLFATAKMVPITDENNKKYVNIEVKIPANSANKTGKLVMRVRNSKWAEGKSFKYTYNIKIDSKPHKLSLKKSTITLNANYPERVESFKVVSNHRDLAISGKQSFVPQPTAKNADGFQKLSVVCEDGEGKVSLLSGGQSIAAGNYKYVYTYNDTAGKENKVALTVKVSKGMPTVSLKGTNSLNLQAKDGERYVEVSEMTMTVKNLPAAQKYLPGTEPSDKPDEGNTGGDNQGGDNTGGETPGGGDNPGNGENPGGDNPGGENQGGTTGGDNGTTEGGSGNQGGTGTGEGGTENGGATEGGTGNESTGSDPAQQQAMVSATAPTETAKVTYKATNPEFYSLDADQTFASIVFATRGYESKDPREYFDFEWVEDKDGAGGKIRISLKKAIETKTYTLKMNPVYQNGETGGKKNEMEMTKAASFKIKVYSSPISSVRLSAKGKINLLDRRRAGDGNPEDFKYTEKNGIRYTPTVANLKDTLKEVRLLADYPAMNDYADDTKISTLFEAHITEDKKSFYIAPKEGAALEKGKTYKVYAWLLMDGYKFGSNTGDGIYTQTPIKVKTAEILPKVKTNKTTTNLYMASKDYESTFIVEKSDEKAIGAIESVAFGEKDEKANDSFEVRGVKRNDGSLEVHLKLKKGVTYGCNTTNKIKMYIQFTGQGTNTAGTPITMNVKINK